MVFRATKAIKAFRARQVLGRRAFRETKALRERRGFRERQDQGRRAAPECKGPRVKMALRAIRETGVSKVIRGRGAFRATKVKAAPKACRAPTGYREAKETKAL